MIDLSLFRRFVPTHVLPPAERSELARVSHLLNAEPGRVPFRRGTASNAAVFLVDGEIELSEGESTRRVRAGTDEARHALSNADRFSATATCASACTLLFVDRARLDFLLAWTQSGTIEVREIGTDGDDQDWMGTMLQCAAMQMIPPANIARVLAQVEPLAVSAGTCIVREGEPADGYYVLTGGHCRVLRRDGGSGVREVARLGPGEGFGEEALLSGQARNATVQAVDDCRLVRLCADDFAELLRAPMLRQVAIDALPERARCIDVRLPEEFAHGHLPGACNLPLRSLRERCGELPSDGPLVVYCDSGGRSAAATFLLCERGFDARWLAGGIGNDALAGTVATG